MATAGVPDDQVVKPVSLVGAMFSHETIAASWVEMPTADDRVTGAMFIAVGAPGSGITISAVINGSTR